MNDFTKAQLIELSQQVYRGSKPCAVMQIKESDKQIAKITVIKENCKFRIENPEKGWCIIWIYIQDELMSVIDCLPKIPETAADHYLNGALFGYSNESICAFLEQQNTSKLGIEINGNYYSLSEEVFELIKSTSEERDLYKLISSN